MPWSSRSSPAITTMSSLRYVAHPNHHPRHSVRLSKSVQCNRNDQRSAFQNDSHTTSTPRADNEYIHSSCSSTSILRVTCSKCRKHDCRLRERVRVNNMSLCVCGCTCVKQHRFFYHCEKSEPIAIKCTTRVSKKTLQKKSASVNVTNDKECI